MTRNPLLTMIAATLAGVTPGYAQTDFSVEVGASQVGPPAGLDGENARFGVAGIRWSHFEMGGTGVTASLMFGQAFGDTTGGDFVSGIVSSTLRGRWGAHWIGGFDAELVGFEVRAPFPYRATALEGGPSLTYQRGPVSATATGVLGIGRSRVELWRRINGPSRVFQDDLWRAGGSAELVLGRGPVRAGISGGVHDTPGGTYTSGGGRLLFSGGWGVAELRVDVWNTPTDSLTVSNQREVTGGLVFMIPMSGWSLRGFLGKSDPDPLTLAEPGSGSGGVLLSRSIFSNAVTLPESRDAYEVLETSERGARLRIAVEAPRGTQTVAVLGDFTLWDPVVMRRDGDRWVVEVDVPAGTHHYGFLVDDEWFVPDDTLDVVPDEWGRESAILVIEGVT